MSIHLVTVGNSIRDNLAAALSSDGDLVAEEGDRLQLRDAELLGLDPMDRKAIHGFLADLSTKESLRSRAEKAWNRLGAFGKEGRSGWKTQISAESTSLSVDRGRVRIGPEDLIVFLSSDTSSGLLSAFWNAIHVAGSPDPLSHIDFAGPGSFLTSRALPRVRIQVITGLDLKRPDRVNEAMRNLAEFAANILEMWRPEPRREIVIHLSGGYKATIPFLIGIAEGMRSLRDDPATVRALVVHEDSLNNGTAAAVPIPLRRFKASTMRNELRSFQEAGDYVPQENLSGSDALLGYAYDATNDGKYTLTAFGHGWKALLGPPSEGGE
jgi:hypothetical protein